REEVRVAIRPHMPSPGPAAASSASEAAVCVSCPCADCPDTPPCPGLLHSVFALSFRTIERPISAHQGLSIKNGRFSLMEASNLLLHRRQINCVKIGRIDFEYWSTNGEGFHSASGQYRSQLVIIEMISVTRMALR